MRSSKAHLVRHTKFFDSCRVLIHQGMLPNTNIISHSFYTQSAFRFGEYYGHIALFPVLDDMKNSSQKVKNSDSREVLREWLAEYFAEHGAKYEFKVRISFIVCFVPPLMLKSDSTWHIT